MKALIYFFLSYGVNTGPDLGRAIAHVRPNAGKITMHTVSDEGNKF